MTGSFTGCSTTWRDDVGHPGNDAHSCIRRHLVTDAEPPRYHMCVCGADIHEVRHIDLVLAALSPDSLPDHEEVPA